MTEQHVSEQHDSVETEETVPSETAEVDESVEATDESADAALGESADEATDGATPDDLAACYRKIDVLDCPERFAAGVRITAPSEQTAQTTHERFAQTIVEAPK